MKKRRALKTISRLLANKAIFERAGISARAFTCPYEPHTLAILPDTLQAGEFFRDFKSLHPERNIFMLNELPLSQQNTGIRALLTERGETIRHWLKDSGVLVATPGSIMSSCLLGNTEFKLERGKKFSPDKIKLWLEAYGYKSSNLVWAPGQYVQRGFIMDIFDPAYSMPVRLEFFDDEIERIGSFHPDTQKTGWQLMNMDDITLHGLGEILHKFPVELFPEDICVVLYEPDKIESQAESFMWLWREVYNEIGSEYKIELWDRTFKSLALYPVIRVTGKTDMANAELATEAIPAFKGDPDFILRLCLDYQERKYKVAVYTNNPVFHKLPFEIHEAALTSGFVDNNSKRVFISDRELSGVTVNVQLTKWHAPNEWNEGKLSPGQLVIHDDYGRGVFRGIENITAGGSQVDALVIEFANNQRLLIPVLQSYKITGLNEHEDENTVLDSLKGKGWKIRSQKTLEQAQQEAKILLEIYAKRELERRPPFDEPNEMYNEFVKAFPFNETADQLKAVNEIMQDLSSNFPMDRLLVGDVGFGKTEVAMRAAFRVINSGFQVCILVPTTILAQQHFTTFQSRFAGFPVKVGLLSRFVTSKQAKETLKQTQEGSIDILIGTHKLLQQGIKFKKLGLLVIDEEHRFGVMHKEGLKQFYGSVDILSLSATPIPRTLAMALQGLRSISVLTTPPEDRLPVTTFAGVWNGAVIRKAIAYELNRGGQVYFLSNKIARMPEHLKMLEAFFPEAKIKIAHGQMSERELEKTMLEFYSGQTDILIATTIIESGLDVGRANTIIIDNAEELGLAQMYQLRGRVGRRGERAFAYFMYPDKLGLSPETRERLDAISTMTELGSGYDIAKRDLDIRGSGTVGGTRQHGNLHKGNFSVFYKMLEEALNRLRGADKVKKAEITSDKGSGLIPPYYIPQDDVRVTIYRRVMNAVGLDELDNLLSEMLDRFGPIPEEAKYLAGLTALRNFGGAYGIHSIEIKKNVANVHCDNKNFPENIKQYIKFLARNTRYITK
ncbi:MAG: DEAD/DEAH box helicase [Synergistaceae bacterium]|nr:DEAD/DEAH box helicase [Synergistaceae bacterium]